MIKGPSGLKTGSMIFSAGIQRFSAWSLFPRYLKNRSLLAQHYFYEEIAEKLMDQKTAEGIDKMHMPGLPGSAVI